MGRAKGAKPKAAVGKKAKNSFEGEEEGSEDSDVMEIGVVKAVPPPKKRLTKKVRERESWGEKEFTDGGM